MAARPYEVTVSQHDCGDHNWAIEVDGLIIARDRQPQYRSPIEAFWAASAWARLHADLGYDLRPNWWDLPVAA